MSLIKGKVYIKREAITGYFMVMDYNKAHITLSPLFGHEKITYQTITREDILLYKLHHDNGLHPIVKARYDHEKMRRLNKL